MWTCVQLDGLVVPLPPAPTQVRVASTRARRIALAEELRADEARAAAARAAAERAARAAQEAERQLIQVGNCGSMTTLVCVCVCMPRGGRSLLEVRGALMSKYGQPYVEYGLQSSP
jgi:septal ring factor EnvC (AmiA/AmiB activator)